MHQQRGTEGQTAHCQQVVICVELHVETVAAVSFLRVAVLSAVVDPQANDAP